MRVALFPHVRVFLLLGLHTSGVVVHLIDSGKDSFEHVIPGQDVLHRLGKLDIDTDALLVQTRFKVFYTKGYLLFYPESVKLFLNNPLMWTVPSLQRSEFMTAIQGHYAIQTETSNELRRSLAASSHYSVYKISHQEIAPVDCFPISQLASSYPSRVN
jgi:hypothetical protein